MSWRYLSRRERMELVALTAAFLSGWALVFYMVIEELCA